jgi:hypothetical protein
LSSMGLFNTALGRSPAALAAYENRLAVARRLHDLKLVSEVLGTLKNTCYAIGDYVKADEYGQQQLSLLQGAIG